VEPPQATLLPLEVLPEVEPPDELAPVDDPPDELPEEPIDVEPEPAGPPVVAPPSTVETTSFELSQQPPTLTSVRAATDFQGGSTPAAA
jgi:hypothetical protein